MFCFFQHGVHHISEYQLERFIVIEFFKLLPDEIPCCRFILDLFPEIRGEKLFIHLCGNQSSDFFDGVPEEVLAKHGLKYDEAWLAKCVDQSNRNETAEWDEEGNLLT